MAKNTLINMASRHGLYYTHQHRLTIWLVMNRSAQANNIVNIVYILSIKTILVSLKYYLCTNKMTYFPQSRSWSCTVYSR